MKAIGLRVLLPAALLASLLPTTPACRHRSETPDPGIPYATGTTSPKLATYIFKEEGKLYFFTVGVNATRFHDKDAFIPLAVSLVNKAKTPLEITRESFSLRDPINGARYGLASVQEITRQGKQDHDRRLMDLDHLATKLEIFNRVSSNFFPQARVLNDHIQLPNFTYLLDTIYFPRPEGELLGKTFELHVECKGLEAPLFVVFTVPEA